MAGKKMGRPATLSADDKDLILEYIESGMSNDAACGMVHVVPATFYLTLNREPEFLERYQVAKANAVEAIVDEAEAAARSAWNAKSGHEVAGAKVFSDFKKWQAARLAPNRWGEKAQVQVTGAITMDDTEMAKRAAFLAALNGKGPGDAEPSEDDGSDLA